jgi:hypothetical protein
MLDAYDAGEIQQLSLQSYGLTARKQYSQPSLDKPKLQCSALTMHSVLLVHLVHKV